MKNIKQDKKQNKNFSIWKYLKRHTLAISFYLLLNAIASAGTVVETIFAANAIQYVTDQAWDKTIITMLIVLGLIILQRACWWATNIIYSKTAAKFTQALNTDLAKQAFKLNSSTYSSHDSGTFVTRIIDDPGNILDQMSTIVNGITNFLTAIVVFVYIATLNLWLSLLLIALMCICIALETFRLRGRRKRRQIFRKKRDKVYSLTTEIVKSEKDIKAMGLEEKLNEESNNYYKDYQQTYCKNEVFDINFWSLRNILIEAGTYAILILGVVFIRKELISLATFMIIYSNRTSLYNIVWSMGNLGNMVAEIKIAIKRISALFDEKEFVTEKFGTVDLAPNVGGGKITFNHVGYAYDRLDYSVKVDKNDEKGHKKGRKGHKEVEEQPKPVAKNQIFEDLTFEIQPNTTVAFVGKSGSGKSTLLNLMSKLYVVDSGEILLNGVNLNDLTKESLRRSISLVNQFPYIFNMSIKDNLLLAKKDASDDEIMDALKGANLDEFVSGLPKGIETVVGEGGIRLSGGQRQRLAIARALLRNSSIIIFDESTSSLDNFAQEEVKKSIDALKGKSTIVIVAHRLSTIKNVDHIYFLDEGKIIDEGTFDELFAKNEKFKTMFMAENL